MKKYLITGLLAMSLVLTSCGSDNKEENNASLSSETENEDLVSTDTTESSETEDLSQKDTKNEGPMANDFKFEDLEGHEYRLSDQRGKKVYIKFWGSWCPICMSTIEDLNEMFSHDKAYEMVTVVTPGIMGEKSKDEFIEWFNTLGYDNIKVLLDEEGQILSDYGIRSAPTNILVGSDGVLMGVIPGQLDEETIDEVFTQIN